jgi:hypothetical protein
MKKQYLTIILSFFIFACGGNAENNTKETTSIVEEQSANFLEVKQNEVIEVEPVFDDEAIVIEEIVEVLAEEKETSNEEPKEEVVETVKEVITVVEKIRADHDVWNTITKKNVSGTGKVDYKGMKTDLAKIKAYLLHLEKTVPTAEWSKNEKLAYWINLYNASTVYLIASNYPTKSITKLSGGKPWDKKFVKSGTNTYSLNDIENNIVRPQFKDPRIHAALNCAAVSCPKLLNGAYLPSKLNAQLDTQVRAWINDATKNKLNVNKAQVSKIFEWYKVDFKDGVVSFINKYTSSNTALLSTAKISYLEYDWALNE